MIKLSAREVLKHLSEREKISFYSKQGKEDPSSPLRSDPIIGIADRYNCRRSLDLNMYDYGLWKEPHWTDSLSEDRPMLVRSRATGYIYLIEEVKDNILYMQGRDLLRVADAEPLTQHAVLEIAKNAPDAE